VFPGEAERKLRTVEERCVELESAVTVYKEFFEASLAMNISAAALPQAARVQRALREVEVVRIRQGIRPINEQSALEALNNISVDKLEKT
jgi:hypothetical protein